MLQQNSGHYLSTIQQLLDEVSPKLSPPPSSLHLPLPSPLFPAHKAPGSPLPLSHYSQNLSSFTGVAAAAAASQRFSPYHYNRSEQRYTWFILTSLVRHSSAGLLSSPYSGSLFPHFPQFPFSLHFPLSSSHAPSHAPELERSHSPAPALPDSPASPIVMERNEFCRK